METEDFELMKKEREKENVKETMFIEKHLEAVVKMNVENILHVEDETTRIVIKKQEHTEDMPQPMEYFKQILFIIFLFVFILFGLFVIIIVGMLLKNSSEK